MFVAFCAAIPAQAQLRVVSASEALVAGQHSNVFARWEGREAVRGFEIEVAEEWSVHTARAVRDGSAAATSLRVVPRSGGRYDLVAAEPLHGAYLLVVGVTVGKSVGYRTTALMPLLVSPDRKGMPEDWVVYVNEAVAPSRNRALHLDAEGEAVALRRPALPAIGMRDPFTVEFWVKTVGLGEVVLSTWDGDEERPYPLEVVTDAKGRIVFYRGQPGRHESLSSARPVADGLWHHVAVTNDPYAGWTRLLVDGRETDSLRVDESGGTLNTMSLALGGRLTRPGAAPHHVFSGLIDELRVWDLARSPVTVRRTMRVPLETMPAGSVRLSFDTPIPPDLLVFTPDRSVRAPSDLSFAFPVEALEASAENGIVTLSWQTKDRSTDAFQIERSTDGRRFEVVGRVEAAEHVSEGADGSARYAHTDLPPSGQVLYYRVRQLSERAPERVSGALKLGRGASDTPVVAIVGNSPNPFRERTVLTYDLARSLPVKLSVWDVSGTRVAVLLDETQSAGRHEFTFAADGLPSGVYFVRLETPDGTAIHKMARTR